jgi:hypothetical protein
MIVWLLFFTIVILVLLRWVARFIGDPDFWRRSAQADVDLYRIKRTMQAADLKQDIRRDERLVRRQLNDELRRLDDTD